MELMVSSAAICSLPFFRSSSEIPATLIKGGGEASYRQTGSLQCLHGFVVPPSPSAVQQGILSESPERIVSTTLLLFKKERVKKVRRTLVNDLVSHPSCKSQIKSKVHSFPRRRIRAASCRRSIRRIFLHGRFIFCSLPLSCLPFGP